MNEFIKENYKNIIVGIISSVLFLYFFQPLMDYLGSRLLKLMSLTGSKWSDGFYAKIAHMELIDFSFYWVAIIFSALATIAAVFALQGFKRTLHAVKENLDHKTISEKSLKVKLFFILINILFVLFTILFLSTTFYQLRIISSFQHHMRVVAPFITAQEEEVLYSKWALMNDAEDYNSIRQSLINIAKSNAIELPENNIYSLTTF